ncbi:patatin-like phospholipase domain-containing protein 2 [Parasteatoda tepidariorum]|uniref:patatin-like phospholipase domain-containing protein 2 n=1 Tax=Parasteatoda tepidariorum TaxID=114398 RepID=UPI00077FA690|nr:patatin-like phospholipase domain-containing protein 2 [Parasteatoda tepidariorum]XP_042901381.1 patatin-like phospholipase domain-containing protein 2 [Parasteatoda tepidariorum]
MSKINLSFAGCGFLGIYHVGVASCFREYAPHAVVSRIAGASVGSVAAAALICDVSLGQTTTDILGIAGRARSLTLGALSPRFNLNQTLREKLEKALPENAHQICSGRLFISVTRWSDKKNVLLSQFDTKEDLVQAILCSCFIPGYSGMNLPKFKGEKYVDGGLSDNLPVLDDDTVTVSPFAGEHDICPQDESFNIMQVNVANTSIAVSPGNMYRFYRILFPPKPEILSKMCEQGFDDALRYLQRRRIISCTRCLGVKSVVKIQQKSEEDSGNELTKLEHEFDGCEDCKKKRQKAKASSLPDQVVSAIQDACDQVNKGLYNYLFNNRFMKLVKLMGMPYTLSYDVSIAIFIKILHLLPDFRQELLNKFQDVIALIKQLLTKLETKNILYRAMFSCELSITEFNYSEEKVDPIQSGLPHRTTIKTEEERVPKRKFSIRRALSAQIVPNVEPRQQRKSYAGFPNSAQQPEVPQVRRKSLSEVIQPERVIRNMRFGFTVGVMPDLSSNDKHAELFNSLKSLGDEDNELNIMELAKTAIGMQQESIHQHCTNMNSQTDENISKALVVPDSNPLMSYCYMDEDKTIKINEIYNVTDADSSLVLTDEERLLNSELEWENNWVNPSEFKTGYDRSFVDSLDDHEFDYSDNECDITGSDVFLETKEDISMESHEEEAVTRRQRKMGVAVTNIAELKLTKPHRKSSFVIMNQEDVDISKPRRKTSFVILK